jgi:uncharacterized protein
MPGGGRRDAAPLCDSFASRRFDRCSYNRRMSLEMRASCERCASSLLADGQAYICSYECTFCVTCTESMQGKCPNCGGELVRRPLRRQKDACTLPSS